MPAPGVGRVGWVVVLTPPPDSPTRECPVCRYDAMLPFPLRLLTATGVRVMGSLWACARCEAESTQDG